MKILSRLFWSYLFLLLAFQGIAQTSYVDSLRKALMLSDNAGKRSIYLRLCEANYSLPADSLNQYVQSIQTISHKKDSIYQLSLIYRSMYYMKMDQSKQALRYLDSVNQLLSTEHTAPRLQQVLTYYKTIALIRNGEYKEAIQLALKHLNEAEKNKDTVNMMRACNNIGWANMELENEAEAMRWLNKGLRMSVQESTLRQVAALYTNLASCHKVRGEDDTALFVVNKGLALAEKSENLTLQANGLNIRAGIYSHLNKKDLAVADLERAVAIRKKIGDLYYIISDMSLLSHYLAYIKQPARGIPIAKQATELAKRSNNINKLIYAQKGLAQNYQAAGMFREQSLVLMDILWLKDSLYEKNTVEAISDIKNKYELGKKENIILQQKHALRLNRYFKIGAILTMLLGSIIVWLAYRNLRHVQKRKVEQLLAQEKLSGIKAVQEAEEKERKRIAADLHDNLGAYAAAISTNIRHLKEEHPDTSDPVINQLETNAQGIVNQLSDTIWILRNEQLPLTKLADRFKAWAQKMMQNYPGISYHYTERISSDYNLTPGTALNIFLILKESLTNSLKHSQCQAIRIAIHSETGIYIELEDDGIGLQTSDSREGLGLRNMEFRAQQCDFSVTWKAVQPTGTRVVLQQRTTN
ncbi:MAG: hypothetical protein JNM44_01825 [Chitinophagaceae bacterium]|nr:hypothetical protein [Chitinophagaceae bacterium]